MDNKKTKGSRLSLRGREILSGYLFILPWLIGIVAFFLLNVFQAFRFSFSEVGVVPFEGIYLNWVGLDNFYHIFRVHGTFGREMFESIFVMIINVPLIIFFSLFMAILLNRQFMGRGLVRAIFFLPVIMASAAIANSIELSVAMMLGGTNAAPTAAEMRGVDGFNAAAVIGMLNMLSVPPPMIEFLVEAIANLHAVIRSAGVQILIFLAALQAIPPSMYEVAQIEGATGYEIFWKITIPMVSPLILTNVVYTVVDTYANAEVLETARSTFIHVGNTGASAAMSLSSAVLVCLVLFAVCFVISKRVFYYD